MGQGPGFSSRNIYNRIPLNSSEGEKAPNQVEDDNFRLSTRFLEHCPGYLTTNQSEENLHTVEGNNGSDPPPQMILPLKTFMAEQNIWRWFLDMSPHSPQIAGFLKKSSFFFFPFIS